MKLYTGSFIVFIGILLSQCTSQGGKPTEISKKALPAKSMSKNEVKLENKMVEIDQLQGLTVMNSLAYNNNASSRVEVIAYLDKGNHSKKIEEKFYDAQTGNYGTNIFYTEDDIVFATKQVYYDNALTQPSFVECVSFYTTKNETVFSKERVTPFEEDLPKAGFRIVSPKGCSPDRAMRALNKTGEFVTTFQGFMHENGLNYLIVGESNPEGYASSLVVQYEDATIKRLKQNEKKYIGAPLDVTHGSVTDERGMKFQVLVSVKIL